MAHAFAALTSSRLGSLRLILITATAPFAGGSKERRSSRSPSFQSLDFDGPKVGTCRDSAARTRCIEIDVRIVDPRSPSTSTRCRICWRSAAQASTQLPVPGIPPRHCATLSGQIGCRGSSSTTTSARLRASTSSCTSRTAWARSSFLRSRA